MLPDPLHPAVVHFPIAFAFLLPLAAIVSLWWGQATRRERSAWVPVLVLLVFFSVPTALVFVPGLLIWNAEGRKRFTAAR